MLGARPRRLEAAGGPTEPVSPARTAPTGITRRQARLVRDTLRGSLSLAEAARRARVSPAVWRRLRRRYLESKAPPARQMVRADVSQPVRIVRDGAGVAHVFAERARDLFAGQGFAVAQDRLWQLDYLRRRALGRLAEVLGPEALDEDRQSRILGFGRLADQEMEGLAADAAEALDGFAAGVNGWMEAVRRNLPVEFEILDYEPAPWTPRDSVAILRAFWWQLTGRLENLAAAEAATRVLGPLLAAEFLRTESPDEVIMARRGAPPRRAASSGGGGEGAGGSNNWAVSPGRSATGHALLATDPHLPLALPAALHLGHLSGGGYEVAGASYPGAPGIMFGRNERIAWGITNLVASPRDLFVETLDPRDPERYLTAGRWHDLEQQVEDIEVRGGLVRRLTVRSTIRGPLVDELVPALPGAEGVALSLRWVGQERIGDVQAMLDLGRARDWASFRAAAATWRLPIFNLVYADVDGHIGWQAAGSIPVRGEGDRTRGYRPAEDPAHAWRGYIAFETLPYVLDPERGWVATANNKPVEDDDPAPLYGWWAPGYRAARLRQLLDTPGPLAPEDVRRMQQDVYSVRAAQAVPPLRDLLASSGDPVAQRLADLLGGWDFHFRTDSAAAVAFETFFELWHERVIAARFPDGVRPFLVGLGAGSGLALRLITEGRPRRWFPGRSRDGEVVETARGAMAELASRLGKDSERWSWGALHTISLRHPLDGRAGSRSLFRTTPAAAPGTSHVLNNLGYAHGRRFPVTSGPEFRLVADLGDLESTSMILSTGQGGQPGTPRFTDHLPRWLAGDYHVMPWHRAAVERAATGEVQLLP
ncbi:MAG: penicillin acylase family protein [Candidatus Rokubacteria bacterium]|nr:penicillin acylase family protein [Candidatus Rokubacteria bacterium]